MFEDIPPRALKPLPGLGDGAIFFDPQPNLFKRSAEFVQARDKMLHRVRGDERLALACLAPDFPPEVAVASWASVAVATWCVPSLGIDAPAFEFLKANGEWALYVARDVVPAARLVDCAEAQDASSLGRLTREFAVELIIAPLEGGNSFLLFSTTERFSS